MISNGNVGLNNTSNDIDLAGNYVKNNVDNNFNEKLIEVLERLYFIEVTIKNDLKDK